MKRNITALSVLICSFPALAATPVNLGKLPASFLMQKGWASSGIKLDEHSRTTDFNGTLHIRVSETFQGRPVWGSNAVVHIPNSGHSKKELMTLFNKATFMNGIVYSDLKQDLDNTLDYVSSASQQQKAIEHVISLYQDKKGNNARIEDQQGQLIVYVDKNNKAHWAFHVSFFVPSVSNAAPQKPTYILDATNFVIYQEWNDIKTLDTVEAGGFGGNHKTGQKIFDGLSGHGAKFMVQRDASQNICYMQNDNLVLKDARNGDEVMSFTCEATNPEHNNIYWNGDHDRVETTWSPSNDVIAGAEITRAMFNDWYKMPMLVNQKGEPMFLPISVHNSDTNAYWTGSGAMFGNSVGSDMFNPFTQLDTVAHEICHGFTEQHSDLEYYSQSGGLNEAFSDMAGIAAEYYAYGQTQYLVGWGDAKAEGEALRYMDQPSRDCNGRSPGEWCSIDHMSQFTDYLDVHFSSGIFNRAYYVLATTTDWNAKKAFDVMVQANINYWTATTSFQDAACGVKFAARDYKYDLNAVANAFQAVGIDTATC